MKSTKQKLQEFIADKDVVFMNDAYVEKISTATEISKNNLDLVASISAKPSAIMPEMQDELLFVLFFMFIDGYEYNHTLGCATYMHIVKDNLYISLCAKAAKTTKLVCGDESKYSIPAHFHLTDMTQDYRKAYVRKRIQKDNVDENTSTCDVDTKTCATNNDLDDVKQKNLIQKQSETINDTPESICATLCNGLSNCKMQQAICNTKNEQNNDTNNACTTKSMFRNFVKHFYDLVDDITQIGNVLENLQIIDTNKYNRTVDLTNYDIANLLHYESGYRRAVLSFCTTKTMLERIQKDLLFVQKFVRAKTKYNFILRNVKQIQNLPYFYRGLIAKNTDTNYQILLSEIGIIINNPMSLFAGNYYETYYALKHYYKILLLKKLVYEDKMYFADDYLLLYLQTCTNTKFKDTQTKRLQKKTIHDDDYKTYNSGKVLCYDLFISCSDAKYE